MYRYRAELNTSGGTLKIDAVTIENGEVLAIFEDSLGSWRKTYLDVESFKEFIDSLRIRDKVSITEFSG